MPVGVGQAQHLTQAPAVSAKVATTGHPAATPAEDTLADVGVVLSVTSEVVVPKGWAARGRLAFCSLPRRERAPARQAI